MKDSQMAWSCSKYGGDCRRVKLNVELTLLRPSVHFPRLFTGLAIESLWTVLITMLLSKLYLFALMGSTCTQISVE